jgi:hypothetical protein
MVPRFPAAARQHVIGEHDHLVQRDERLAATHNNEFAWLAQAWRNLPETLAGLYPTPESLRKRALIEAGEEIMDCAGRSAALRVAAFDPPARRFRRCRHPRQVVVMRITKSQSHRPMDRSEFAQCKDAIVDVMAQLLGARPGALQSERAA